jgi:hypothetical protein
MKILNKSILQIAQEVDVNFTEDDYFYYIIESRKNGNKSQARELYLRLSTGMQGQRVEFHAWVDENYGTEFKYDFYNFLHQINNNEDESTYSPEETGS